MSYETNDKVIFKYKGEFQVGVITGKSNLKDNKLSFFTSRQDRNLDILVEVWKENIFNKDLKYKLFVTPIKKNLA